MFTTFMLAGVLSSVAELADEGVAGSDSCFRWEIAEIDMVVPKRCCGLSFNIAPLIR